LDSGYGKVDHASDFSCEVGRSVLAQATLRLLGGKPGGIPMGFLRRFKPRNLTEMSADAAGFFRGPTLPLNVVSEGGFLDAAMDPSLLEGFEGGGLGVGQPRFGTAFGESPMCTVGPNEQELDTTVVDAVTNGGDLIALPQLAKL
jgi:hypothetical protein